jgi:hypothetical protein
LKAATGIKRRLHAAVTLSMSELVLRSERFAVSERRNAAARDKATHGDLKMCASNSMREDSVTRLPRWLAAMVKIQGEALKLCASDRQPPDAAQ